MGELFELFLKEIPGVYGDYVKELDSFLTDKGSKRTVRLSKSGYLTSYTVPGKDRMLLNYVFRKSGVRLRIYAQNVAEYDEILNHFPPEMKKDIIKAGDCKKLNGLKCTPACPGGYKFYMDGVEYRKCRSMAFFHSLKEENLDSILKIIEKETEYDQ